MTKGAVSHVVAIALVMGITGCTLPEEPLARGRERMLIQFTASEKWIVFPIALDREVGVLAVLNRETGHRMLVSSGRNFLAYPQFSADGKRLLMIRRNVSVGNDQLLSCAIDDWRCRIFVDAATPILSPVEVRKDLVLYAAGQLFDSGKRVHYDFYLVDLPSQSVRLSTFKLYSLHSLSVSGDRIMFSAFSALGRHALFPEPDSPFARASSEIFMLQADWKEKRLIIPTHQLERLYAIDGLSTLPTMSEDGTHVAFINGRIPAWTSNYRYNLVIAKIDGTVRKYVEATTPGLSKPAYWGFSRPAFVGSSVLANQLFEDRYETTLVDLQNNSTDQIAILYHTPSTLAVLERREIRIAE